MRTQKVPPQYSRKAAKIIGGMDASTQKRIARGISKIPEGDIVPFEGTHNSFRLRVGKWRVIFRWHGEEQVFVQKILTRGGVYKGA